MAAFWPIGTAQIIRIVSYPIRKKSRFWLFCMWSVKEMYHALLPNTDYRDKGRGHDRRLNATKQQSFWRIFRYSLSSIEVCPPKKITSSKENLCICKYFILEVLYILRSAWAPWFEICVEWFLPSAQPILLTWSDWRTKFVSHELLLIRINLWVLNKMFREIISLSVVVRSSLTATLAQNTLDNNHVEILMLLTLHASLLRRSANLFRIFTVRFSFGALFDTQLMNFIWKYFFRWFAL